MGSEAEKAVTAEEVPQEQAEETPKDGEAPPTHRPKRLTKPDVSRHKAEVDEMHNKLKERKNNIEAINDKIRQIQSGGSRNSDSPVYDRLKKLRADWDAALAKKRGIQTQLKAAEEQRRQAKNDHRDARSSVGRLAGSGTIDEQIADLESRLHHTTMTASEEKRCVEEIGKLRKAKKAAAGADKKVEQAGNTEKRVEDLRADIKDCDDELNAIKEEQTALRKKLEDAKTERDRSQNSDDVRALRDEISELRTVNDLIWKEIQEKNAQFKADNDAYWEAEQVYRKWYAEERKRREERDKGEREAKEKEWAAQEAERSGEWYYKEIDRCDQLTHYLAKIQGPSAASAAAGNGASAEVASIDGYKVFKKKDADADELMGLSSLKRSGKKSKKGAEKGADKPVAGKLTHSLDTINSFGELKVVVPLNMSQIPGTLETLKARKQHYLDERAKKVEAGEAPPRESKPSANGSAPKAAKPTENGHAAAAGPSPAKPAKGGKTAVDYQDEDMFPSLMGTKGAVEAFPHNAAAMEPAGATGADMAKEGEPEEASPTPEPTAITA